MKVVNSKRIAQLSMDLTELLSSHPEGMSRNQALTGLINSRGIGAQELASHPYRPFVPLFEEMIRVGNVALVRAGWLAERSGYWAITPDGQEALKQLSEPDEFLKTAATHSMRARLAIAFPALYIALRRWKYQLAVDYNLVKRVGLKRIVRQPGKMSAPWQEVLPMQGPARRHTALKNEIADFLRSYRNDSYISAEKAVSTPLNALKQFYSADASFVVTHNSESTGAPGGAGGGEGSHAVLAANLLYSHQLGPRVYDVVNAGSDKVFVVSGKDLKPASTEQRAEGWRRLSLLQSEGLIKFRRSDGDAATDCPLDPNCALVDRSGNFNYVGFDDIVLKDYEGYLKGVASSAIGSSHFGDRSLLRGGHYLYQSIPGVRLPARRDTKERIATITRLMESVGASFEGALVLDIGCNIGMMMAEYGRLGVRWQHGWDRMDVAPHAERLLLALGCTSFSMTGRDISKSAALQGDLPEFIRPALDGCIISYLAVRKNLGFLDCLGSIPWSLMIYEGHEEETEQDFQRYLLDLQRLVKVSVKAIDRYQDGDCGERIIAMIVRE
ncbi:MAG TPA: hypothetical protein VLZ81_04775 [Blastocatellia bacterium]|nr:hypothetical protein [Blastocatellia bacterium]